MASAERCIQGKSATPSDTSNESKQPGDSLTSGETSRTNTFGFGTFSRSENSTVPLFGNLESEAARGQSHEQEICTNTTTITQGATGFQFGANSGFPPPVFGRPAIPNMNSSVKCGFAVTSTSTTTTSSIAIPDGYANSSTIGTIRASPTSQASGTTTGATHSRSLTSSLAVSGSSEIESFGVHVTNSFCSTSTNLLSTSNPSSGFGYGTHGRKRDCDDLGLLGQSKPITTAVTTTVSNNPFGQFSTAGLYGQSSTSSSFQFPKSATNSSGSMGVFEQQSGSMFGFKRTSGGFGFGQPQTRTSSGPFSFCSSNSSRAEGGDGKPSNENVRHNVFGSPQNFSVATNQDNALFGNQSAKSFSSSGSTQTSPFSGGIFSNESGGGVGHLGFGISQQQKQQASVVGQAITTTSTSSNQPLSASMSIDDDDQLINNTPAAEPFSSKILTYLTEDEKSQITKQRGYEDSRQVAPTTTTKTAQRATGLNSGFLPHAFGEDATPSQYFRTPKFDSRAQASDARSFSDLARSGGSAFSSVPNSASSTFGTSESGQCNTGFGSEGLSGSGDSSFGNGPSFKGYRF